MANIHISWQSIVPTTIQSHEKVSISSLYFSTFNKWLRHQPKFRNFDDSRRHSTHVMQQKIHNLTQQLLETQEQPYIIPIHFHSFFLPQQPLRIIGSTVCGEEQTTIPPAMLSASKVSLRLLPSWSGWYTTTSLTSSNRFFQRLLSTINSNIRQKD